MRTIKMTAKREGHCTNCRRPILPGQVIWWRRGAGAHHDDCARAQLAASQCTACTGKGIFWNGRQCGACDGTGARKVQEFAQSGGHKPDATDLAYEDDCGRRCGLI